jgi:hypothetical protein
MCYTDVSDLKPIGDVAVDLGDEGDAIMEDVDCLLWLQ